MYDEAMQGIHDHLVKKSPTRGLAHTIELLPSHGWDEEYVVSIFDSCNVFLNDLWTALGENHRSKITSCASSVGR